jgi:Na+-transporting methylmalonyl-CoA/oxaloacetate decarboxylase gamma subunit
MEWIGIIILIIISVLIVLAAIIYCVKDAETRAEAEEKESGKTKEEAELSNITTASEFNRVVQKYSTQALDLYNSLVETEEDIYNRRKLESEKCKLFTNKEMWTIVAEEEGVAKLETYYKELVEEIKVCNELYNLYSDELHRLILADNKLAGKISYLEINGVAHQGLYNSPMKYYTTFVDILNKTIRKYNKVQEKLKTQLESDIAECNDLKEILDLYIIEE